MLTPLRCATLLHLRRGLHYLSTRILHGHRPPLSTVEDRRPGTQTLASIPPAFSRGGHNRGATGDPTPPQQWTLVRAQTGPNRAPED